MTSVWDFNTYFLVIDKTGRQKMSKNLEDLKNIISQPVIYRTFHPNQLKHTFFSRHGKFPKIDHILCQKINLLN